MKARLATAGCRGRGAEFGFLAFRTAAPVFCVAATVCAFFALRSSEPFPLELGAAIAAASIGLKAPDVLLEAAVVKRRRALARAYPDTLDCLLLCVESGLSLEAAARKTSEAIGEGRRAMAEEMSLLAAQLSGLSDHRAAFETLSARAGLGSLRSLTTALAQSERYGAPLGAALRALSLESRGSRLAAAEREALPRLALPTLLFFLPALLAAVLSPAAMALYHWN